jgi:hypothetical protein
MSINIQETFQKMPLGEKIILPAAVVLFIDSFLHWYSVSVCVPGTSVCVSGSASAWGHLGAIWSILAVLIGLVMAGIIVVMRFTTVKMPALPEGVTWARVQVGLAGVAVLFILIKLINHSSDLAIGFFIGIICVAALAAGAGLLFQAEGGLASLSGGKGGGTTGSTGSTM